MTDEQKALALACECAGRKMHHYALMGDDLPLKWSIVAHADTIMHYKAMQAERDAQAAEIARLREALGALANHCWEQERIITEELHGMDYSGESLPLCNAYAALAQETQT